MHPASHSNPSLEVLIQKLSEKFASTGQDLASYLEGLLYAEYLSYWDYIHLDTLLSLQKPKTAIPDEQIFIIYHQITELYFKLILLEFEQIHPSTDVADFIMRVQRANRYFRNLALSFDVMSDGMEQKQFLRFRMALLPASGFQSVQYRMIEIKSTDFIHLVDKDHRSRFKGNEPIEVLFEHIYWKQGATELASGKKTYTLQTFEDKYAGSLKNMAESNRSTNLFALYRQLPDSEQKANLRNELRRLDSYVNVNWPLAHYKTAVRYLERDPESIAATGGTNWQKYLPPRFQRRVFYPELWTSQELDEWGKAWVEKELFGML
jgi:tryptophan 2,3-dioxygenase